VTLGDEPGEYPAGVATPTIVTAFVVIVEIDPSTYTCNTAPEPPDAETTGALE
jgi:hypothetical protein